MYVYHVIVTVKSKAEEAEEDINDMVMVALEERDESKDWVDFEVMDVRTEGGFITPDHYDD